MFRHILVPLDGSPRAEQAIPVAVRMARASRGTITLFQAVNPVAEVSAYGLGGIYVASSRLDDELYRARLYLDQRSRDPLLLEALHAGIALHTHAMLGNPAELILTQTANPGEPAIDAIVISSHGYTGVKRWMLGSVAEKVARHALVPVLILREGGPLRVHLQSESTRTMRALVPLDTSPRSQDALVPAAQLLAALSSSGQGELHLAQMIVPPEQSNRRERDELFQAASVNLAEIGQTIREGLVARFGPDLHPRLSWSVSFTDDIAEGIVRLAEEGEKRTEGERLPPSDVIALTTHGFGGGHRWQIGSIAGRVLHATRLPILLVRPEDMLGKASQDRMQRAGAER
ncbi:MAG TPA: universal stress protein [Ktedonobacteraceae bacterium]|nr:universal stress protein [Ktedonobacteraceae bacterium]